jgi:alpha-glucosidase
MQSQHHWWETGAVYQIYPRSYMDSNGDGIGDLNGITSRLDYVQSLGVDAVWLSPIYPSPMADFGYDISDYQDVAPIFGTLADFDRLVAEAHRRGLKVVLDFVPNHTSDEHSWFVESRSSRDNPKRDWYIWKNPAADGGPPNNWLAAFGGNAWDLDPQTGQYYLHLFHRKQPDLNWRNPDVRRAMLDVMRFWLSRGVDGFRVDVIWLMIKDEQFRDNPVDPQWKEGDSPSARLQWINNADQPEVHEICRLMRAVCNEYGERVLIGEIFLPTHRLMDYYGVQADEVQLPFNFQLVLLPWKPEVICRAIEEYESVLPPGGWPNWVLGNHDQSRISTRVGAGQARVAQMLLLTLRGTPTYYYGDEIGMHDVPVPPELVVDPAAWNSPKEGRDPERSPMQWDASPNAGFTSGTPWLPIAGDYATANVAIEDSDPTSMLQLVRRLLALRRRTPALSMGDYRGLNAHAVEAVTYLRQYDDRRVVVALNLSSLDLRLNLTEAGAHGRILLSTHLDREGLVQLSHVPLRADEGVIIELD